MRGAGARPRPRACSSTPPAPGSAIVGETVLRLAGKPRRSGWSRAATSWCRKLFDHDRGYIFQLPERRIVFALPFADDFTLIGTTDEDFSGEPRGGRAERRGGRCISAAPRASFFARRSRRKTWSGRSPACARCMTTAPARPEDVTRDYHLALDQRAGVAPLLTVYGGKITTYRRLAEDALGKLAHVFSAGAAAGPRPRRCRAAISLGPHRRRWWRRRCGTGRSSTRRTRCRLVRAYGTRVHRILGEAARREDLGAVLRPAQRRRGPLPDGARMGAHRRGRAVAAEQARPAPERNEKEGLARFMAEQPAPG